MSGVTAGELLFSWNAGQQTTYAGVAVEDDLRDALQSVRARRPSLPQRRALLDLDAELGVRLAFLGFPAASRAEQDLCADLVGHIAARKLPITPILMARAVDSDLRPILDIQQNTSTRMLADIYIPTSALRLHIEGWTLDDALDRIRQSARTAQAHGLDYRIAFEDSTRTEPDSLRRALTVARETGTRCVVLNDTVGESLPDGAARHVAFAAAELADSGIALAWHGHNDRGLALANALAAVAAGATVVSGTFLGVGERTGNIALEQLLVVLDAGTGRFGLKHLAAMRDLMSRSLGVDVPPNLPIVGADAFTTATGTHAAAIAKARALGAGLDDLVYSGVNATALGLSQTLLVGPNSGRAGVRAVLADLGIDAGDDMVERLLQHCKSHRQCLTSADEILAAAAAASIPAGRK